MAKMTLLEMTQSILSAMDSDPVDSIDETVEAIQVADIVKEAFFELMSQRDWPFLFNTGSLQGLGDVNNPTKMKMPDTWKKVKWIKYNKKTITYIDPETFTEMIDNRAALAGVINANGYVINADPVYWTSFDDTFIIFDGFNNSAESTLQASNSKAYASIAPTWSHVDSFIPALPEKFFPTLLAESKSQAFVNLKQQSNNREERKAQRGRMAMRNEAWRNDEASIKFNRKVNYGRR
jgi:hypothetical protein